MPRNPKKTAMSAVSAAGTADVKDDADIDDSDDSNINVEPNWKAEVLALRQQLQTLQTRLSSTPEQTVVHRVKLPPIPLIEPKLDGKLTYRKWSTNIEAVAQSIDDIWDIIKNNKTDVPASKQQYARSLLVLNMVHDLQLEIKNKTSAATTWTYLKEQFETDEFADLVISARRLRTIQWSMDLEIEQFYRQFKEVQTTVQEVTGQPLQDQLLISFLLCAIDESFPEFTSLIEAQLSQPMTPNIQKTFESVFGRFRTEYYRKKARQEKDNEATPRTSSKERCSTCDRTHGPTCYVQKPNQAPVHLREHFKRKHEEWKASTKATDEDLRIE